MAGEGGPGSTAPGWPHQGLAALAVSPQVAMDGTPSPSSPAGLSAYVAVSQLLGLTLLAATGAWLGRYRGGVAWQNPLQFNAHPLCMVLGMVFLQGDGEWKAPVPPGWVIEWVGRAREMWEGGRDTGSWGFSGMWEGHNREMWGSMVRLGFPGMQGGDRGRCGCAR